MLVQKQPLSSYLIHFVLPKNLCNSLVTHERLGAMPIVEYNKGTVETVRIVGTITSCLFRKLSNQYS